MEGYLLIMTKHSLTPKQQTLLLLLYKFRFLNRIQIQTILNHKTFNRINTWLKELYEKQYIGRILNTQSKINNTPAIYYLSKNGISFLKTLPNVEKTYLVKLYKESTRSEEFIQKCIFIADTYIHLQKKYTDTTFKFYTQSDYSINGLIKEIFPSFLFRKELEKPYNIVEIFKDTMPRYAIRSKISKYIDFFTDGQWLNNEHSPNILFICPDKKIEKFISTFSKKILNEEKLDLNMYVSTLDQINNLSIEGEVWDKVEVE